MVWGALIGAGIGAAGSLIGGSKAAKGAEDAAEISAEQQEQSEALFREGLASAEAGLQPYADQEAMGRNQMMRQLGLVPAASSQPVMMGQPQQALPAPGQVPTSPGMVPMGGGGGMTQAAAKQGDLDSLISDMLAQQQVLYKRAGYNGSNIWREAAQRTSTLLDEMKKSGQLPADFQMPSTQDLTGMAEEIEDSYGGHTKMADNLFRGLDSKSFSMEGNVNPLLEKYGIQGAQPGGVDAGIMGPGQMVPGQQIPPGAATGGMTPSPGGAPMEGEYIPAGAAAGGVEDISSIMGRAGASADAMPEGFAGRYYEDIEGPTPQFGMGYTENPAYQQMMDEVGRNVNAAAAGSGALYSGARGEALREASAKTNMNFYQDAADRERAAYEAQMGRRGSAVGSGQSRQDSYYNNYMNMLQNLSSPATQTNLANMQVGAAGNIAKTGTLAAGNQADYAMTKGATQSDMYGDIAGGLGRAAEEWI